MVRLLRLTGVVEFGCNSLVLVWLVPLCDSMFIHLGRADRTNASAVGGDGTRNPGKLEREASLAFVGDDTEYLWVSTFSPKITKLQLARDRRPIFGDKAR